MLASNLSRQRLHIGIPVIESPGLNLGPLDRFEAFGTAGQAPNIKPLSLAEMAARYQSGSLDPTLDTANAA